MKRPRKSPPSPPADMVAGTPATSPDVVFPAQPALASLEVIGMAPLDPAVLGTVISPELLSGVSAALRQPWGSDATPSVTDSIRLSPRPRSLVSVDDTARNRAARGRDER